jgi:hypothetical protein
MLRSTPNTLEKKLVPLLPDDARVEYVRSVEGHVHPINHVKLSNGQHLFLKVTPYQTTSLVRRERWSLETEARVLILLNPHRNAHIPQLIEPETHRLHPNPSYLLRHLIRGMPLSELESSLKYSDWEDIDRRLGSLAHLIGRQTSPYFGCVSSVSSGAGCSTWRNAFLGLIESALRDAEDTFISLPYAQIRQELYRLVPALDSVAQPRLVIVDLGKKSHVILDPQTKQVSGIVDFSWAVWGDPLMTEAFENPSPAFFRGYGSSHPKNRSEYTRLLL